jgi:hypothetical protein
MLLILMVVFMVLIMMVFMVLIMVVFMVIIMVVIIMVVVILTAMLIVMVILTQITRLITITGSFFYGFKFLFFGLPLLLPFSETKVLDIFLFETIIISIMCINRKPSICHFICSK